ncbi:hypothetical protein TH25_16000 [Thalassospira profundimaris]|uniref:Uncharacterized protein n=1 Tax=Thalassospira profundimaris TaxID=502049 RepID=A0A367X1X6_9PROT|nr:hypothetical protein [Thalassospira profundimaris]RCK47020.1 hypothetical protein TH25_16000 [Thalassospira profundimaris]
MTTAGGAGPSINQLEQLFDSLSTAEITKFTRAIESDRNAPRLPLPHDQILQILRPRLASLKPERYPTPMRQFCTPFEDLLQSDMPSETSIRIGRPSLVPIWKVVCESASGDFHKACKDLEAAAEINHRENIYRAERILWAEAATCIEQQLAVSEQGVKQERALATHLGSRVHMKPFAAVARILRVAEPVTEMRLRFPSAPIRSLSNSDLVWLREKFLEVSHEKPGYETDFMSAVLARLLRPSELFKVIRVLSSKADDRSLGSTNLASAGDMVIDMLAEIVTKIEDGIRQGNDEHQILQLARWYASEFVRITRELNIRKDGPWGERLLGTRRRVSQAIANTMFGASPERVTEALPQPPKAPMGRGAVVPPLFAVPFDGDRVLGAEQAAEAIAEMASIAHILAAQSSATKAVVEIKKKLNQVGRAGVDSMAKLGMAEYENAQSHLMAIVRLLEIIDGPEDADLLRRRGMSALRAIEERG